MFAQVRHRFSLNEYYRMAESGVLRPDAHVELVNGEIIDVLPLGPFHEHVVERLERLFHKLAQARWLVFSQYPVYLDNHSEPQPDLLLLKPIADGYAHHHPRPEDIYLLVEVSETTLDVDREVKLPAYGRAGIAEVWIVDLKDAAIEVYRQPYFAGYISKTVLRAGSQAAPLAFPEAAVNVTELLKR